MTSPPGQPRLARAEDVDKVAGLVVQAYSHYIERMGKPLGPMLDDYARRITNGEVWVVEADGEIAGLVVLEDDGQDALLLDNIAAATAAQGASAGRAHNIVCRQSSNRLHFNRTRRPRVVAMT